MSSSDVILKGVGLHKFFEGVHALNGTSIDLIEGDLLGVVGENGAGKSTLLKVLVGEHDKNSGEIFYRGKEVNWNNPYQAMLEGVGLVHQRPYLVPELTAAENIFLGKEFTTKHLLDASTLNKKAEELLKKYPINLNFDLSLLASEMSAGQREITEILKVLSYDPKILILDEPTASLAKDESEQLMIIIRQLNKEKNLSVIFISHRIEEVFDLCTRIVVLRNGKRVGEVDRNDFDKDKIIYMIINRNLSEFYPSKEGQQGDCFLEVKNFISEDLKDISIKVDGGEIVGLYGLSGAGMTELVESIFGVEAINSGKLYLHGQSMKSIKTSELINNNIYFVPEDRDIKGLFKDFSIKENLVISHIAHLLPGFLINRIKEKNIVKKGLKDHNIIYSNIDQEISSLSGGNQQKVVIAKWLQKECDVLILDDPTVGVDIGTKREVYLILRELTKQGKAIILVSSDILEIIGMADRIYTMREGAVSAELSGNEINQKNILENVL
ncbi:MAG TPA: D-xylose ABC transporter ATP-binding protein [Spirochaeta sp.]|nr:D-xylose ABC transporter ATP-binding protein [Spirochaeta sp.]